MPVVREETPSRLTILSPIFIVARFRVRPEYRDQWLDRVSGFSDATRAEPGNLWFEWSRSLDNPAEYVLVEAFRGGEAGAAHVSSDHFKAAQRDLPQALVATPKVISQSVDATGWSKLAEITVD